MIAINSHSFRGEYEDPNDLFKAICGVMKSKPDECASLNLVDHKFQDTPVVDVVAIKVLDRKTVYNRMIVKEEGLEGMQRRAKAAELIFGILMVCIINCACLVYCKMYNKKK